jgi:tRNA A-37 threonylcarbamoyl transferase component Bud32
MLNIDTPKPVAYIEKYKGLLVWSSYIVTEFVQGQNLHYFLRDENIAKEQKAKTCRRVGELLDKLNKFRISHGDLKLSNIIIAESGPKLIDLDGMAVHKCKWMYRLRGAKDLKSWEDLQDAAGLNIDNAG